MPTPTKYTYSIQNDFPNHIVASDRLTLEINQSTIVTALDYINTSGDNCDIWFKDVLSVGDQTTLSGVVAAHSGLPLSGTAVTGSFTAVSQTVVIVPQESGNVGIQLSGTWVGTLAFEGTIDGANWFSLEAVAVLGSGSIVSTTINGQWQVVSSGLLQVRVRSTAWTSGSASVTLIANGSAAVIRAVDGVSSVISGYSATTNSTRASILATTYTEQLTNAQRSMSSSSANDTSAGTGARVVRITYYDQTMAGPFTEDVTLNGTSSVNTVATNICFIESMRVITAGSLGNNQGVITLFISTAGGGGTLGTIALNDNQTNWCHHYIATGLNFFLQQVICGNQGASNGNLTVLKTSPTIANTPDFVVTPQFRVPVGTSIAPAFAIPIRVTGPARVILQIKQDASTGTNNWFAGFGYQEV